jgi:lysophospholipase L1-like esterase
MPIKRYPRNIRWPGVLQHLLGENYYVIEEGLNSRTTNINYQIPPDRNGKTYLAPCLYSQSPIDLVILALGGNDLKVYFDRTAEDVRDGLAELIDIIQSSKYGPDLQAPPAILLMTAPMLLPIAEQYADEKGIIVFDGARAKGEKLISYCSTMAKEKNCHFLDITKTVPPSEVDGLHFDDVGHKKVADLVFNKVKKIFLE